MQKKLTQDEFQTLVLERFSKDQEFQTFVLEQLDDNQKFQKYVIEQFGSLHSEIKDIKEVLYPLAKAFDIDSLTLVDHGKRLTHVEKYLGFKGA